MEVFVYGTLTDPTRVQQVVDDFDFRGDAVLDGLHRVDGEYPTLAPGGEVEGRILSTDDVAALDAYEGVDRGLYVRVPVPVTADAPFGTDTGTYTRTNTGQRTVQVYVGDPDKLDVLDSVERDTTDEQPTDWQTSDRQPTDQPSDESGPASFSARVRAVAADCVVCPRR